MDQSNYICEVVGESFYARALNAIMADVEPGYETSDGAGHVDDGWRRLSVDLTLVAEPNNPHDAKAVAVMAGRHKVGYVPRTELDWLRSRVPRRRLRRGIIVHGLIYGTGDVPYGVRCNLDLWPDTQKGPTMTDRSPDNGLAPGESRNHGTGFVWEVVPNPARRVMLIVAWVLTALLIACLAVGVDGLLDYGDRPARCDSLAVFDVGDEDLSNMCEGFVNDGFRGFVFLMAAVPVLFWASVFWALWATRDPYRQRLTRSR